MKTLIIIIFFSNLLFSQEKEAKPEQKPFDLPEAIIYGNDQLNIKSGFKRNPSNIPKLSAKELDSLNSLEKVRPSILPVSNLPYIKNEKITEKGYLLGSFGNFITSNIEGGYSTSINDFQLYLNGGFEQSRGHVKNAEYSKIQAKVFSDYIAPEKYFIFGGSKTRTAVHFENFNYTNYYVRNFESRNKIDFGANIDVDGNYEGFVFETGAGLNLMKTAGDSLDYSDKSLSGYLKVQNPYNKFNLGFNSEIDLRSGNGIGNSYGLLEGIASYKTSIFELKADLGYQIAEYYDGVRNGLKFDLNLNSNISNNLTFKTKLSSGIKRNFISKLNNMNRFINYDINIDHTYNNLLLDVFLTYHKDIDFYSSAGVSYGSINRNLNFANVDSSYFKPLYLDVNQLTFLIDGFYNINEISSINYVIKYNSVVTDTLNKNNTYIPNFETEINYNLKLSNGLSGRVGFEFVGTRYADIENKVELSPFFNMNFELNYRFDKNLSIFANVENLFNQDIFIYNNYIERGFFGKVGVNYNF